MRTRFFILAAAIAVIASCAPETPETALAPAPSTFRQVFHAVMDGGTRSSVVMNNAGTHADVVWDAGDKIEIIAAGTEGYLNYTFQTNEGGSVYTDFFRDFDSDDAWVTTIQNNDMEVFAFYPSELFSALTYYAGDQYAVQLNLPPVQKAVKGGVEKGLNLAIAYSDQGPDDKTLYFKNILSLVHFTVDGPGVSSVKKAILTTTYEPAGSGIYFVSPGGIGEVNTMYNFDGLALYSNTASVTLEGTFEAGGDYYFALFPGQSDGFTISFVDESGRPILKSSSVTLNATRSRIVELGTITVDNSFGSLAPGVELYMSATQGPKPINIAVVGDGFTSAQQDLFSTLAHAAVDKIFDTPPYSTYKDRFNVYVMSAVSNESGASVTDGNGNITQLRDTYFNTRWGADSYDDMRTNSDKVFAFVSARCPQIASGETSLERVPILLIANDPRHAGICMSEYSGRAIAMTSYLGNGALVGFGFPSNIAVSDSDPSQGVRALTQEERDAIGINYGNWTNTALHEFGGHAFGRLSDEYWYTSYKTDSVMGGHSWEVPFGLNVSGTYDNVPWQSLLDNRDALMQIDPNYGRIGRFQGGDVSVLNRWRSEIVSCMIDDRAYFSAWQRILIVQRIMALSGDTFDFNAFLASDVTTDPVRDAVANNAPSDPSVGSGVLLPGIKMYPPGAPPVFIDDIILPR